MFPFIFIWMHPASPGVVVQHLWRLLRVPVESKYMVGGQSESLTEWGDGLGKKRGWIWDVTAQPIGLEMKDRNRGLRNKQEDHQSVRDSKCRKWGMEGVKIKQREAESRRKRQKRVGEIYMAGEECCISDPVLLCHLNHCRFLMPEALLYKAQTAAGFSTLLPWNWINTTLVRVFLASSASIRRDLLSQVAGHLSPPAHCWGGTWASVGECMARGSQNSRSLRKHVCQSAIQRVGQ